MRAVKRLASISEPWLDKQRHLQCSSERKSTDCGRKYSVNIASSKTLVLCITSSSGEKVSSISSF
jgi:hypothetical protein